MPFLFSFVVGGQVEVSRRDLEERGAPAECLLRRNLRDSLCRSCADEPGWTVTGSLPVLGLSFNGRAVATVFPEGEGLTFAWVPETVTALGWKMVHLRSHEQYLADGVAYYQNTFEGRAVRKILDKMLEEVVAHPTFIPGVWYTETIEDREKVLEIHGWLPEVRFWGLEVSPEDMPADKEE